MQTYALEVTYGATAWAAWVQGPHSCAAKIAATLADLGGRLVGFWWANADFDSFLLVELPDAAALTSFRAFVSSLGGVERMRATGLISDDEGVAAVGRAASLGRR